MNRPPAADLREEYRVAAARLEEAATPEARSAVKAQLIDLFRRTEAALGELTALREEIRGLAERFKQGGPADTGPAPAPRAVRADHLGASTFVEKGWSLIALGDHQGAITALRRARELAPGDRQAEALLGWALMLNGQYDEALTAFSSVLQVEPDNALARVNLGYVCLKKRIFGEAIEHLSRVLREGRDRKASLYANYYLGLVYLERAMYPDAQAFFQQALALGPNLHEAAYDLGRAQWFGGEREAARATWRSAASAAHLNPWARRCGELLAVVEAGGEVPRSSPA